MFTRPQISDKKKWHALVLIEPRRMCRSRFTRIDCAYRSRGRLNDR